MAMDPMKPVRELALGVPGAAGVFDELGIDYCCAGAISLSAACAAAGLRLDDVAAAIEASSRAPASLAAFHDWRAERPSAVAVHIVEHDYPLERASMADTAALLSMVASVHGANHPELRALVPLWGELCARLKRHQRDEAPVIEPLAAVDAAPSHVRIAVGDLAGEHEEVVAIVRRIRTLTSDYAPPPDACDALRALYRDLEAFESELHEHVLLADRLLESASPHA